MWKYFCKLQLFNSPAELYTLMLWKGDNTDGQSYTPADNTLIPTLPIIILNQLFHDYMDCNSSNVMKL